MNWSEQHERVLTGMNLRDCNRQVTAGRFARVGLLFHNRLSGKCPEIVRPIQYRSKASPRRSISAGKTPKHTLSKPSPRLLTQALQCRAGVRIVGVRRNCALIGFDRFRPIIEFLVTEPERRPGIRVV